MQGLFKVDNWAKYSIVPKSDSVNPGSFGFNPVKYDGVSILYLLTDTPPPTIGGLGSPCEFT